MSWIAICATTEIPNDTGIAALVNDQQIAVFNVDDNFYAIDNYDPIGKANILSRGIVGCINAELCVASPLYKQHYSLLSGRCIEQENIRVKHYPLRCVDGMIEIDGRHIGQQAA